jgi:ATP-dependent Clp protease protease subunit
MIGEINQSSAARVMMQMLYLEDQKRGQQINLYINSPGGAVDDTLAMYDTMQMITSDVATYCIGRAYSGAAVLLCAGSNGKRHILPHAKVMIHQPYGGITGQTTDIQIQAEQIQAEKKENRKYEDFSEPEIIKEISKLQKAMLVAARNLEFENAGKIRDQVKYLKERIY